MAFIKTDDTFFSYAEYQDVLDRDQRVFEANEAINVVDDIEDLLIRSSERINSLLYNATGEEINGLLVIGRQNDFTDMTVYHCLYEYLLPKIADFGEDDNTERRKIEYYQNKFQLLFDELVKFGGWYDEDEDSAVTVDEFSNVQNRLKRIR